MFRLMSVLSLGAVLVCLALATPVDAQLSSPAIQPPPLSCSLGIMNVQAVTDTAGSFPVLERCPADPLDTLNCLKWSYQYSVPAGNTISLSAVTVDSDVEIVLATTQTGTGMKIYTPGESDAAIGNIGKGTFDARTVRFASQGSVVLGHIITRGNVAKGSTTAIGKIGNQGPLTCQIAGPDNIDSDSVTGAPTAVTTTQIDQFEGCEIVLTLDTKGCPSDIEALSTTQGVTCTVNKNQEFINGKKVLGGQCNKPSGFTVEGSTCIWYCPTSTGRCFTVCK